MPTGTMTKPKRGRRKAVSTSSDPMKRKIDALTPRQLEVVRLVSLGCIVEEIANIMNLATSTVDNHKAAAMRTVGTDKATLLTRLAIKYKIAPMDDKLTLSERRKSGRKNDGWN